MSQRVLRELNPVRLPLNPAQEHAQALFPRCDVLLLSGVRGSGKTHCAVELALDALLRKKVRRIILSRPTVSCGSAMGHFPGSPDRKMGPWLLPIQDVLRRITNLAPQEVLKQMEVVPLQLTRGRTFDDAVAILDECQNATWEQLELFVTRLGKHGKIILCGDPEQCDLREESFADFTDALRQLDCVGVVDFTDSMIVRHPHLAEILQALRKGRQKRKRHERNGTVRDHPLCQS